MARLPVTFLRGCKTLDDLPPPICPEVCFAGRSNVGKSSLINAVTGISGLARASNTPGRTRELNFFSLANAKGNPTGYLVDLPGYGYAKAPKTEIKQWTRLTRNYLRGRPNLRRVFLLIDSRHGLKENDLEIMKMFAETAVTYQIVLTKTDKIKKTELETCLSETQAVIDQQGAAFPLIIATSSEKGEGLEELRRTFLAIV